MIIKIFISKRMDMKRCVNIFQNSKGAFEQGNAIYIDLKLNAIYHSKICVLYEITLGKCQNYIYFHDFFNLLKVRIGKIRRSGKSDSTCNWQKDRYKTFFCFTTSE